MPPPCRICAYSARLPRSAAAAQAPADDEQRGGAGGQHGEAQLERQHRVVRGVLGEERGAEEQDHHAGFGDRVAALEPDDRFADALLEEARLGGWQRRQRPGYSWRRGWRGNRRHGWRGRGLRPAGDGRRNRRRPRCFRCGWRRRRRTFLELAQAPAQPVDLLAEVPALHDQIAERDADGESPGTVGPAAEQKAAAGRQQQRQPSHVPAPAVSPNEASLARRRLGPPPRRDPAIMCARCSAPS
jgi:hypothetical protein